MDDKPQRIPKKYRVSLDPNDIAGYALLQEADEAQKDLAKRIPTPFKSPRGSQRNKAWVTIRSILDARIHAPVDALQTEVLAEAWATVGRYELARDATKDKQKAEIYQKYVDAVNRPDSEWCNHPDKHKYIKEYIFSVKHNKEMPLLACGRCSTWNVADTTAEIVGRATTSHAGKTKNMSITQAMAYHQNSVK